MYIVWSVWCDVSVYKYGGVYMGRDVSTDPPKPTTTQTQQQQQQQKNRRVIPTVNAADPAKVEKMLRHFLKDMDLSHVRWAADVWVGCRFVCRLFDVGFDLMYVYMRVVY